MHTHRYCPQTAPADGHAAAELAAGAVVADALPDAGRVRVALGVPRVVRVRGRHRGRLRAVRRGAGAAPARGAAALPAAAPQGRRGAPDAAQVRARAALPPRQATALPLRRLHVARQVSIRPRICYTADHIHANTLTAKEKFNNGFQFLNHQQKIIKTSPVYHDFSLYDLPTSGINKIICT